MTVSSQDERMKMLSRGLGCFYGQMVGDALGSRYEFKSAVHTRAMIEIDSDDFGHLPMLGEGPFGFGPGVVTDDSEMATSLLSSLIRMKCYDTSNVACCYARWALTHPPDIGITCRAALHVPAALKYLTSDKWFHSLSREQRTEVRLEIEDTVRHKNGNSLSNGSLMRQSTIAAFLAVRGSYAEVASAVEADTHLTHCHPNALSFGLAFSRALFLLIQGKTPEQVHRECLATCSNEMVKQILEESVQGATPVRLSDGTASDGDDKAIGFAGVALQSAFYEMLHASSFEEGVVRAIARGGDTDTNGAIVAAILGARFGVDGIPEDWQMAVRVARLRLEGENGIDSFEYLEKGLKLQYTTPYFASA